MLSIVASEEDDKKKKKRNRFEFCGEELSSVLQSMVKTRSMRRPDGTTLMPELWRRVAKFL